VEAIDLKNTNEGASVHDTLDLKFLQEQAQKDQKQQQLNRKLSWGFLIYCLINIFPIMVLLIAVFTSPGSVSPSLIDAFKNAFVVSIVLFLLWQTKRTYSQVQSYAHRVSSYASDFVPPLSKVQLVLLSTRWLILTITLLFALYENLVGYIAVIMFTLGAVIVIYFYWRRWINVPHRAEKLLHFLPNYTPLLNVRSINLLNSGQLDEAEQLLRQLLTQAAQDNIYSIGYLLNNLGYCLLCAEKYDEALPILESCVCIIPAVSFGYTNLSAWYIEQDLNYERALELSDIGMQYSDPKFVDSHALEQVVNARALALTGRDTRAEAMLAQALSAVDRASISTKAEINRQAGYVRLAQGNQAAARAHFEQAAKLEPDGMAGKLAKQALENMASIL
jgi:tetratricopeptide (TPR) repeat protein